MPANQNPFMGFTSRKGERPNTPGYNPQPQSAPLNMTAFQTQSQTQTPFGSMPNLQAYQNQQDAFVQQFLQNQAQYNQGLMAGGQPKRVDLGTTWAQAGDNIQQGTYQGNPFATGNVDSLMGMFGQYGITPPAGFRDQLISQLGQQSAPPQYQPPFDGAPRPLLNPSTGLPSGQPATGFPMGPNGEYWPGMPSPSPVRPQAVPGVNYSFPSMNDPTQPLPAGMEWKKVKEGSLSEGWLPVPSQQISPVSQQAPPFAPGYGGRINAPPGSYWTTEIRDRDGDMIDDRDQPGPGLPPPGSTRPIPPSLQMFPGQMVDWGFPSTPAGPDPTDPWSYPLRPGMRRGPNGEQIMTAEARQAEIQRLEKETGRRYVPPRAPGQTGGWLPAPRPASQNKDQSAAMAEYIRTQAAPGRARPTPTRTQVTRR